MVPSNDHSLEVWVREHTSGLTGEQIEELLAWASEHFPHDPVAPDDEQLVRQIEEQLLLEQVARIRRHASLLELRSQPLSDSRDPHETSLDPNMMYDPGEYDESGDTTQMEDTDEHEVEARSGDAD